jgi:hypothetical protein
LTTSYTTVRQITYVTTLHLDSITISTHNHPSKWIMVINIEKIMENRDQKLYSMTIVSLNNHKSGFVIKKLKWNKFYNIFYIIITLANKCL